MDVPGAEIRFFTVTDDRYFPGLVGLLNSLHLAGHTEPVTVLDHGLTESERKVLRPHCDLVSTRFKVRNPCQLKAWSVDPLKARRDTHCFLPLLRRVLTGRDVTVRVPNRLLPPWLWRGTVGGATFRLVHGWLEGGGIRGNLRRLARALGGPNRVGSP